MLAIAGRTDGLIGFQLDTIGPATRTTKLNAPDADFIDVCSLASAEWPFAVAAFCLDRSVVLVRDLLANPQPETLQFDGITGTPYAIRCAQGHLFLLTSEHVSVYPNLVRTYLDHAQFDERLRCRQRFVRADDIFVTSEDDLLMLVDAGVEIDDVLKLGGPCAADNGCGVAPVISGWTEEVGVPRRSPFPYHWANLPTNSLAS